MGGVIQRCGAVQSFAFVDGSTVQWHQAMVAKDSTVQPTKANASMSAETKGMFNTLIRHNNVNIGKV